MSRNEIERSAPGGNGICLPADVYAEKPVRYDNINFTGLSVWVKEEQAGKKRNQCLCVKRLMQKLGISEIADNDVNEVSGGTTTACLYRRSLINHPRILFADEPTGSE